jgi:hypothetical protein
MRYAIMLAALLAACSTTSDVLPLGNDRYSVTATHTMNGMTRERSDLIREATVFCAGKGKQFIAETFDDQTSVNNYNSRLIFTCK